MNFVLGRHYSYLKVTMNLIGNYNMTTDHFNTFSQGLEPHYFLTYRTILSRKVHSFFHMTSYYLMMQFVWFSWTNVG